MTRVTKMAQTGTLMSGSSERARVASSDTLVALSISKPSRINECLRHSNPSQIIEDIGGYE